MEQISAKTVKSWLSDGQEIAFIDVREHGQYGEGHPFFVSSVPFSRLEHALPVRVPNPKVRLVLLDQANGVAQKAADAAERLGYENVHVLNGGAPAWQAAGFTLYQGVNVPSKTFAEIMELERHTPAMKAQEVAQLKEDGVKHVILDGRPLTEFGKFSIPGGVCCPNGELVLRFDEMVDDEDTTIVVNCAGRTRSIIGSQTLIDAGVRNPVYALENGTQGWVLAGLERAHGVHDHYPKDCKDAPAVRRDTIHARAMKAGVQFVSPDQLSGWLADPSRTTYVLDVRTPEEFDANGSSLSVHAPGGQLVQGTDEWIGTRGARIVLIDNEQIRAPMTGYWLAQLGHQVFVLDGGVTALNQIKAGPAMFKVPDALALPELLPAQLEADMAQMVDLRGSMAYRKQHIEGARWSIRSQLGSLGLSASRPVVLIGSSEMISGAARDLASQGFENISRLGGDVQDWKSAGLTIVSSPAVPVDEECIDHLFFTAERHTGNAAHSHQYLDWEINLVNQIDEQERAAFTVVL